MVSLVVAGPRRVRLCGLGTCGEVYQVVEHLLRVSGLVAIGTHAVSSLCISESPEGNNGELKAEVFLHDPRMIDNSRDIPNVNRCM